MIEKDCIRCGGAFAYESSRPRQVCPACIKANKDAIRARYRESAKKFCPEPGCGKRIQGTSTHCRKHYPKKTTAIVRAVAPPRSNGSERVVLPPAVTPESYFADADSNCPHRANWVDMVVARLRARRAKIDHAPAVLESSPEVAG
jgi:hypothetical protein